MILRIEIPGDWLERRIDRHMSTGMSEDEARHAASDDWLEIEERARDDAGVVRYERERDARLFGRDARLFGQDEHGGE